MRLFRDHPGQISQLRTIVAAFVPGQDLSPCPLSGTVRNAYSMSHLTGRRGLRPPPYGDVSETGKELRGVRIVTATACDGEAMITIGALPASGATTVASAAGSSNMVSACWRPQRMPSTSYGSETGSEPNAPCHFTTLHRGGPVPRQKFVQPVDDEIVDAGEHIAGEIISPPWPELQNRLLLYAARPMPRRSFEVCRPNFPTSLAGANRSCAAPISVPRGSIAPCSDWPLRVNESGG